MLTFVLLAAVLTTAGLIAVVLPLVRERQGGAPAAPWSALAAGALLVGGSLVLYVTWSNWSWNAPRPQIPRRRWWRAWRASSSRIRRTSTAG